jgi:hypothetical protein
MPTLTMAASPTLTQCGIISGLSSDQLDFAAATAFMSDSQRQLALGTEDMMGQVGRCAAQVREEICSARVMMDLLKPGSGNVAGAASFAIPGLLSKDAVGALSGGSFGWAVGGIVGTAAKAKECAQNREILTQIADRLGNDVRQFAQTPQNISYQGFVSLLRRSVPARLTMEEAERLAKATDATRRALSAATR